MQCEKCGKEYTGEEAVCPECKVPIDGAAKREDAVVAKEADGNPETAGVAGESAGSVEEGTSESDGSEADDGENGTGEEDQEEAGILDESQVEEPAPPRKYGKFIVLGVVLAAVILLAVFSKPVFYGIGYNVAKQMENKSEGIALTFGKVAFKFNQTEDVKQLLERVYLAKAERQVYTDIDAAIRTANAGLAYYKFEDLNVFMESAKELKADVQAYGGNYVAAVGNDRISIPEFKVFLNQAKNQAEQAQGLLDDKTK